MTDRSSYGNTLANNSLNNICIDLLSLKTICHSEKPQISVIDRFCYGKTLANNFLKLRFQAFKLRRSNEIKNAHKQNHVDGEEKAKRGKFTSIRG